MSRDKEGMQVEALLKAGMTMVLGDEQCEGPCTCGTMLYDETDNDSVCVTFSCSYQFCCGKCLFLQTVWLLDGLSASLWP